MAAKGSMDAAPPAYPQADPNAPLLAQGGYPQQPGYPPQGMNQSGQPLYPQAGQYQPVPTDKQGYAYPPQQAVAYQPTTMAGQPMVGAPNVVIVGASQTDPRVHSISDLLCLSVFTTVCCNLLFGIIAIVFSIRVRDAKRNNDYEGAKSAHKVTLIMNVIGIVMSVVIAVIVIVLYATMVVSTVNAFSQIASSSSSSSSSYSG